ncbi:MAG: sigma-70 family RNA polymerase sigma factor [Clostridia bacterium]|nr:sigma-70 family RNA polymerase sigma factor [Clostridia bacterium]
MLLFNSTVAEPQKQDKISRIYLDYYSCMAYSAGKYLKNKADIEDTVHDTMVKLISVIDTLDLSDPVKVRHLCSVVARNTAINRVKLKSNNTVPLDDIFDVCIPDTPESVVVSNETVNILVKAINSLGDTYRDVCRLRYINGLKVQQIASLLELNEKTVNQRLFRAKQMLRKALVKENINGKN